MQILARIISIHFFLIFLLDLDLIYNNDIPFRVGISIQIYQLFIQEIHVWWLIMNKSFEFVE